MILTINSGSTSIKLGLFETVPGGALRCTGTERHAGRNLDAQALLGALNAKLPAPPQVIAHRIVHGGTRFVQPVRIDSTVLAGIEELSPLAPLHNPPALRCVQAARSLWPQVPQVAVFDTAFFAGLPRVAAEYALPARLGIEQGVRRYGFHGLAHQAMWHAWCELAVELPQGGRLITLQLGGGCSITAIDQGKPLDTSMGFSPLEGLIMETRSGDADPAIVPYLERRLGLSGDELVQLLNTQSGLAGLSGADGNPAALLQNPAPQARFALELYCYRIRKYVGAYLAVLGGCDGIVFGGGVGEHVPYVRERSLAGLKWAGITLDEARNRAACGGAARIDTGGGAIRVEVIPVDEESTLAGAALALLNPDTRLGELRAASAGPNRIERTQK
jgi:acetate kinase